MPCIIVIFCPTEYVYVLIFFMIPPCFIFMHLFKMFWSLFVMDNYKKYKGYQYSFYTCIHTCISL